MRKYFLERKYTFLDCLMMYAVIRLSTEMSPWFFVLIIPAALLSLHLDEWYLKTANK